MSANRLVGEHVPLPEGPSPWEAGRLNASLAPGTSTFYETDTPGVYSVETAKGAREFAVNLDPSESKTAPLPRRDPGAIRLPPGDEPSRIETDREMMRQMQNAELEGRQKLWRPVILAAISVLIVETWLAGWHGRPRPARRRPQHDMSRELRQALEQVAQRVREVRLWSSLAVCWSAWAVVGACSPSAGGAVSRDPRCRAFAALVLASGSRASSSPCDQRETFAGRTPHRGGTSRAGRRATDSGRGRLAGPLGPAGLPARRRRCPGHRTPPFTRLGPDAVPPVKLPAGPGWRTLWRWCGLAAVAFSLALWARPGTAPGGSAVTRTWTGLRRQVTPGDTEIETGMLAARRRSVPGRRPAEASLVVEEAPRPGCPR